jgi:hypothetical protein
MEHGGGGASVVGAQRVAELHSWCTVWQTHILLDKRLVDEKGERWLGGMKYWLTSNVRLAGMR